MPFFLAGIQKYMPLISISQHCGQRVGAILGKLYKTKVVKWERLKSRDLAARTSAKGWSAAVVSWPIVPKLGCPIYCFMHFPLTDRWTDRHIF